MRNDIYNFGTRWLSDDENEGEIIDVKLHNLIVWNDEVNTFDWVIESLVVVCDHDYQQAAQCTMIIHNAGKYAVKKGTYEYLESLVKGLSQRDIMATIA